MLLWNAELQSIIALDFGELEVLSRMYLHIVRLFPTDHGV